MFLGVLKTVFLSISNYLPLELRNRSIQIVVVTHFVVISNVGIKRFDCTLKIIWKMCTTQMNLTLNHTLSKTSGHMLRFKKILTL